MIVYVKGVLAEKEPMRAVVEASGLGYELQIPLSTFDRLPREGGEVKLLTAHIVREDDEQLFGFATEAEREFFLKLIGVSGVGPKMALAIVSGGSVGELSLAIASGNAKRIASVKGVGKKTAEKICVELKDKVNALEALASGSAHSAGTKPGDVGNLHDAILALSALGFNEETATKMVSAVATSHPEVTETDRIVRLALKGTA